MSRPDTLLHTFLQQAEARADDVALQEFGGAVYTWRQWERAARAFGAALVQSGCAPGEVVGILAGNTALWPIADIGSLMAGCVSVGVYPTSPAVQVFEVLNDCAARVVVVDSQEQLSKVLEVRAGLPNLRVIVADLATAEPQAVEWSAWLERGRAANGRVSSELERRMRDVAPNDIAILIYTSGSTGTPKGARISHRYLSASAAAIQQVLDLNDADTTLSFLPFCHAAERIFGLYTRIQAGMSATMIAQAADLWEAARTTRPTLFGGLPRFYEKIYEALQARYAALSAPERLAWDHALELGRRRSQAQRAGQTVPAAIEDEWRASLTPIRAVIEQMIGGRVRVATSGGATLPEEVAETLAACGLTVLGAYGLTEHLCVSMHRAQAYNFTSVGLPMPGTTLRISESGEIQIRRSALTFTGYHNNAAETAAAFTADGEWLCTGDLGDIDAAGYLHVTGRAKELIALSGGKKVAPAPIERKLLESPLISQAVLFGEGRKYICALIALREQYVRQWAHARGRALRDSFAGDAELRQLVQHEVDRVNLQLARPEQIRRFAILPRELSLEQDELTPTMKIRRNVVAERYRDQLEALYETMGTMGTMGTTETTVTT